MADGNDLFSWEKDDADPRASILEPGVPAYRLSNCCRGSRYRIDKMVVAHPDWPAVLQRTRFVPGPKDEGLHLYALVNPHLGDKASAWIDDFKGVPMLFAEGNDVAVALASSAPWLKRSVGFVGTSDGWQDLSRHCRMTWQYDRASGGNVAMTGHVEVPSENSEFLLVIGFGPDPDSAGFHARAALLDGMEVALKRYVAEWKRWQEGLPPPPVKKTRTTAMYRSSTAVLRAHQSKREPGAEVASLSIPFGTVWPGDRVGGYHLVWPRDLVEIAGGFLAAGTPDHIKDSLLFFEGTQEADGHWAQNMWLSGKAHWNGIQMDETALVILLFDLARRERAIGKAEAIRFWPMLRRAVGYLVRNGPATPEDRWEHDGGYSTFTLAVEIAALLVAAELARSYSEGDLSRYLRETADLWNESIERWTYVVGTDLAKRVGVDGYYVRLGPPAGKDRPKREVSSAREGSEPNVVSPDVLALVRFGLRAADDSRIVNTVKVIDSLLKVDLGYGPGWRRYNGDWYGEAPDGRPFDESGDGVGRAWPLLAGERGHYELAAGRKAEAERMLRLMELAATETGLIPEQVWDEDDIPDRELYRGRPTHSACPLAWAHAEYIKLLRSIKDGAVFDMPRVARRRYSTERPRVRFRSWRFDRRIKQIPAGLSLRIELAAPAVVRWSLDGWKEVRESTANDIGLGLYVADLPSNRVPPGGEIVFTFRWTEHDHWEGTDFRVAVAEANEPDHRI